MMTTTTDETQPTCVLLKPDQLLIPRTTFIVAITLCVFITSLSIIGLTALLYREYARRIESNSARAWGRRSIYNKRLSHARKEIDLSFRNQYSGCLVNMPENPELGSDSPVELMQAERVWEAPAVPAQVATGHAGGAGRQKRKSKILSLFFDPKAGVWMPSS
jgi:hypothetical protein